MYNLMHLRSCSSTVTGNRVFFLVFWCFFHHWLAGKGLYMAYVHKLHVLCICYTDIHLCARVHTCTRAQKFKHLFHCRCLFL